MHASGYLAKVFHLSAERFRNNSLKENFTQRNRREAENAEGNLKENMLRCFFSAISAPRRPLRETKNL